MKVMITGASGLLGRAIKKQLEENTSWQVIGLCFSRQEANLIKVDLRNSSEVRKLVNEVRPDVVIHCAAERRPNVFINNAEEAVKLNVTATELLAQCVNDVNGFMLYISTNYVFDGTKPPYKVTDKPNPLNQYGETKLQGEVVTLKNCKLSGVLRVPVLFGDEEYIGESAVTGLFKALVNVDHKCNISHYEQRYPTSTSDVAAVCQQIISYRINKPEYLGIWHWRSADKMTKYQMVVVMSKLFNLPLDHITPDNEAVKGVPRPFDSECDCSDLENVGIGQRTPFEIAIKNCLAKFRPLP